MNSMRTQKCTIAGCGKVGNSFCCACFTISWSVNKGEGVSTSGCMQKEVPFYGGCHMHWGGGVILSCDWFEVLKNVHWRCWEAVFGKISFRKRKKYFPKASSSTSRLAPTQVIDDNWKTKTKITNERSGLYKPTLTVAQALFAHQRTKQKKKCQSWTQPSKSPWLQDLAWNRWQWMAEFS